MLAVLLKERNGGRWLFGPPGPNFRGYLDGGGGRVWPPGGGGSEPRPSAPGGWGGGGGGGGGGDRRGGGGFGDPPDPISRDHLDGGACHGRPPGGGASDARPGARGGRVGAGGGGAGLTREVGRFYWIASRVKVVIFGTR